MLRKNQGFTLIEIMAAVAISAAVLGIVVVRATRSDERKVKAFAYGLATKIRYLYHKSALEGLYITLNFDLGNPDDEGKVQSYDAEGSNDPVLIVKEEGPKPFKRPKEEKKKDEDTDTDAESKPSKEKILTDFFEGENIPSPARIKDIWVEHQPRGPLTEGLVRIHFFPNGLIERAIINLTDEKGKVQYSVATDPLRGLAEVRPEYREIE